MKHTTYDLVAMLEQLEHQTFNGSVDNVGLAAWLIKKHDSLIICGIRRITFYGDDYQSEMLVEYTVDSLRSLYEKEFPQEWLQEILGGI